MGGDNNPLQGQTDSIKEDLSEAGSDSLQQEEVTDSDKRDSVSEFDFDSKTVLLNSGYEMPIIGLGTYSLDYDTCVNSVKALLR